MLNGLNPNNNQIYFQKNLLKALTKNASKNKESSVNKAIKKATPKDDKYDKQHQAVKDFVAGKIKPSFIMDF